MLRKIIEINEEKCDGCGNCVPECHEGALQIIDGKARLISDLFCDGLGACIGFCPTGALQIVERVAEPYNEKLVMEKIVKGGANVIKAHLQHLKDHKEFELLTEAIDYLNDNKIPLPELDSKNEIHSSCASSKELVIENQTNDENYVVPSQLTQWPIQLHLVSPVAQYYRNTDFLLAADCCAFSYGNFHNDFIKGKSIAIACPKLDSNKQIYLDKLVVMLKESKLNSINVTIMQVPCCRGLAQLAIQARELSEEDVPIYVTTIGVNGEILETTEI
ncbi:MAG: 4Fe-4S binding protein [Melioribacteraceae bacterium]|nr:4Fe-4S binding protein [Melioribacteraceae bacterium]